MNVIVKTILLNRIVALGASYRAILDSILFPRKVKLERIDNSIYHR